MIFKNKKELVGTIAVDSCQILLVDPSYLYNFKEKGEKNKLDFSYSGCCNATLSRNGFGNIGTKYNKKLAFVVRLDSEGYYPVFIEKKKGVVKRIIIECD